MKRTRLHTALAAATLALAAFGAQTSARAQTDGFYIGQLQQYGYNWCPLGWAQANGALLSIAQNSALFALLGTTFGGDGQVTFALPDLRDRAPVGYSNTNPLGEPYGQSSTTLTINNLPMHSHTAFGDPTGPVGPNPSGSMLGLFNVSSKIYAASSSVPSKPMNPMVVTFTGNSFPMSTQMPVLATNWCIALEGVFPSHP